MVEHEAVSIQSESVLRFIGQTPCHAGRSVGVGIVIALLIGIIIDLWAKGADREHLAGGPSRRRSGGRLRAGHVGSPRGKAVEMSSLALVNTADPAIRTLAYDVVTTQQSQIGMMQGWLSIWDSTRPEHGRVYGVDALNFLGDESLDARHEHRTK